MKLVILGERFTLTFYRKLFIVMSILMKYWAPKEFTYLVLKRSQEQVLFRNWLVLPHNIEKSKVNPKIKVPNITFLERHQCSS